MYEAGGQEFADYSCDDGLGGLADICFASTGGSLIGMNLGRLINSVFAANPIPLLPLPAAAALALLLALSASLPLRRCAS